MAGTFRIRGRCVRQQDRYELTTLLLLQLLCQLQALRHPMQESSSVAIFLALLRSAGQQTTVVSKASCRPKRQGLRG